MPSHSQPSNDTRASLQRRFTTDLSSLNMPMLAPIGQQSQPAPTIDTIDMSSTVSTHLLLTNTLVPTPLSSERRLVLVVIHFSIFTRPSC